MYFCQSTCILNTLTIKYFRIPFKYILRQYFEKYFKHIVQSIFPVTADWNSYTYRIILIYRTSTSFRYTPSQFQC